MYLSVTHEAVAEQTIQKSRFLAYIAHTEGEEEARAFLARIKSEHPQATHVCYAFVADRTGVLQRFSDAGEPQGTAGMPILGVLKAQKLCETAIAVVRYFGGIKLGAGGLTRAYSSSAAMAVASSEVCEYDDCIVLHAKTAYSEVNPAMRFLERESLKYESAFLDSAEFVFAVREGEAEGIKRQLAEYLNGKVEITEGERKIHAFPRKTSE